MDSLGSPSRARSRELGAASYALLFLVLDLLLDAGVGAIVESNFSRDRSETELREPVSWSQAVQRHCRMSPDLARRRYIARAESGQRSIQRTDTFRTSRRSWRSLQART